MGISSTILGGSVRLLILILAIAFIPGIPPALEFEQFSCATTRPLTGPLSINDKLNSGKKLFLNEIKGPEHLEVYNNVLYTTLEGGHVVKISGNIISPVVKFGKKCDGLYEPELCGRPLGLSFDRHGFMYVADAYYGIFKVNITTGEYVQLVSMSDEIEGKVPKLPNSVAVSKDGSIYWSDSSTSFQLHDLLYISLGNGDGRLVKYDPNTKISKVLIDKIHVANGVALSQDESFVIVSELFKSRILRYNLKGPKAGEKEVFLDGLPGYPDNIHSDGKGGFFVSLAMEVDEENPGLVAQLAPYPVLRRLLARLVYLLELPALWFDSYLPGHYAVKMYTNWIGSSAMYPFNKTNRTTIIFFNEEGKITQSLHCTNGEFKGISDFAVVNNTYYLGSFTNPYLVSVKAS